MTKTPTNKKQTASPEKVETKPRKLKLPKYRSFRLEKRIKTERPTMRGGLQILREALRLIVRNWRPLLIIVAIYGILNILLVQSFGNVNLTETKAAIEDVLAGHWNQFLSGISIFAFLVGKAGNANTEAAGAYQFILLVSVSLAIIWALRRLHAGEKIRARDAYYRGMYPIVPFIIVLAVMVLQLLPFIIGSFLYSFVGASGPVGGTELLMWGIAIFLLATVSLYLLSSSIFALYVVCLPDMPPGVALRSAKELVFGRRWLIIRRILVLPVMLLLAGAVIMIPAIMFITPAAIWIFFLLTLLAIVVAHGYMYQLYRELLDGPR